MDQTNTDKIDLDEKRKILLDSTLIDKIRFQVLLEQSKDKQFSIPIFEKGAKIGEILLRRWTHEEVQKLYALPFYAKFTTKEKLTPEEETIFGSFQEHMVLSAMIDRGRWSNLVISKPEIRLNLFNILMMMSGIDEGFAEQLERFMDSDQGFAYGYLWFYLLRRVPSEIGQLPETDVKAINLWATKWLERAVKLGNV